MPKTRASAVATEATHRRHQTNRFVPSSHQATDGPLPAVHLFAYGGERFTELIDPTPHDIELARRSHEHVWLDVTGVNNVAYITRLTELFGIHHLAAEDIVHLGQRTKVEEYDSFLFVVFRTVELETELMLEQMTMAVGDNFVLTFQERPGDCLDGLRQRLRGARGKARTLGSDYLAYAIMDGVVDHFFPVFAKYSDEIDEIEEDVLAGRGSQVATRLLDIRRDLLQLKRCVWPLRDALTSLVEDEYDHIGAETRVYLRDCLDHSVRLTDMADSLREHGTTLMDVNLAIENQKMGEVMKVLTMFSTIFMPLSFIAGVYGMNFSHEASPFNMPELDWRFGYPATLAIMFVITILLLGYFRARGG